MNSDNTFQRQPINLRHQNLVMDGILSNPMPSFEEKPGNPIENLSAIMNIIDESSSEDLSKKSFLFLSKHNTNYHRHSFRSGPIKHYKKFAGGYSVLPEIKGYTLDHTDTGNYYSKNNFNDISNKVNTVQDLTKSILQYGGKTDVVFMRFLNSHNGPKLVRPGFSARRYMINLIRHFGDNIVEKLIAEGSILEKNLFRNSILLPHIRRRISADLSRYPEPYRILKQMLIAPGPLNEYSFIWKNPSYISRDSSSEKITEMQKGDIKILLKKDSSDEKEIYEEVQYSKLSHDKKKTVLSNLLIKSAMNHAIKIKDEVMEHNVQSTMKTKNETVHNIHIPVVNFDMMEAVTDLLNKETIETLSTSLLPSLNPGSFKGHALRSVAHRILPHADLDSKVSSEKYENPVFDIKPLDHEKQPIDTSSNTVLPNLTLRLHPTNISRISNKKKSFKSPAISEKHSSLSNTSRSVISLDPFIHGILPPDNLTQKDAPPKTSVENEKNKVIIPTVSKDIKTIHGINEDEMSKPIDHMDNLKPDDNEFEKKTEEQSSFTKESIFKDPQLNESLRREKDENTNQGYQDQSRLIQLLTEQAETVAEKVLTDTGGGEDFASDVNIAIMEILNQKKEVVSEADDVTRQIWNLEFEDKKNQEEYGGRIKDVFKSIFANSLNNISNDNINISPEIMSVLQEDSNLALDNIEVQTDPITGKIRVTLKEGVSYEPDHNHLNNNENMQQFLKPMKNVVRASLGNAADTAFQTDVLMSSPVSPLHLQSEQQKNLFPHSKEKNESQERNIHDKFLSEKANISIDKKATSPDSSPLVVSDSKTRIVDKESFKNENDGISKTDNTSLGRMTENIGTTGDKKSHKPDVKKSKKKFVIGVADNAKETMNLHSQSPRRNVKPKLDEKSSKSKLSTKKSKIKVKSTEDETGTETDARLTSDGNKLETHGEQKASKISIVGDNEIEEETNQLLVQTISRTSGRSSPANDFDLDQEQFSEDLSGDDDEEKERKRLIRQNNLAKRNLGAEKKRLEVERKRKEKEEQRKLDIKRRELEENMTKRLEEERRLKEEELRLRLEREKDEELERVKALNLQEYLRLKHIEKARREKEEFNKRLEEIRLKQALEEQRRKEEQEKLAFEESEKIRIENEMISRMQEKDRILYLQRKAEEEERKRIMEEEERILKEEQARLALEEARRILQQQAREKALLEARLNFVNGVKVENEGLKKYLNITRTFVWSYFEFLKILGMEPNPATDILEMINS